MENLESETISFFQLLLKKRNDLIYSLPKDRVFITPSLLRLRFGENYDPNIITRWQKAGRIIKIRNGLYRTVDFDIRSEVDRFTVSNNLYEPSYVSLHSALHYYGLIPEHVYETTAISTRKTKSFEIDDRRYSFRHVKTDLFFGYEVVPWREHSYCIARPEKALIDLAYLESDFSDPAWIEGMRFDHFGLKEDIDWTQMFLYAHQINSETLFKRIALLLEIHDL
ncbi:type IV toxin-antitoxin system AbiEi family antitoxin domain-containing protein [Neolewinella agarilytica]|uniref:Transcriptional regulator, AbiEi antitoxin, Type IV TA system n=1 Tax=Neolewinella agarilytica TaxID=478744 RepID=A0A1H9EAH5_9BACT|nr:hypothetical protein [Neolewinella agarilytica]SEQ22701.1 Transcriptional regulator, AbiEi antitoxin, Type IV TA system [Neolewinella agarilytica]